jgi:integrase
MARTVRNSKLDSRAAREKLPVSGNPYYCSIGDRLHLGYRKGKNGAKWVMRRYIGAEKYVVETIGASDDFDDADGVKVLTFHQAQGVTRERVKALNEEARIAAIGPAITVRDAVEEYAAERDQRETCYGGRRDRNARARLTKHVLDADEAVAAKPMAALTADDLIEWREGLKGRVNAPQRTVNDFKAALNRAARRYKQLPPTIRNTIRDGLASARAVPAQAREAQILPDADVRAIISAAWEVDTEGEWDGDLARAVLVLAATGARFSQVIRMTVADVQTAQKRLMVPVSRKGRGVKKLTHIGVRVGHDVLAALTKATTGRKGHEALFLRPRWRKAAVGRWEKRERGPWSSNHELGRLWPAIVARAGLSAKTVPYALRHSSIVRALRAGLPVRLVAALHDTSSAMIEAHYAAFIVDAMDELAARAVVPLTTAPATVTPIAERPVGIAAARA